MTLLTLRVSLPQSTYFPVNLRLCQFTPIFFSPLHVTLQAFGSFVWGPVTIPLFPLERPSPIGLDSHFLPKSQSVTPVFTLRTTYCSEVGPSVLYVQSSEVEREGRTRDDYRKERSDWSMHVCREPDSHVGQTWKPMEEQIRRKRSLPTRRQNM